MMTIGVTKNRATRTARITTSTRPSSPQAVEPGEAVVDRDDEERRGEQHDGDGGREAPREELLDLLVDELRDHHVARRAEQDGRHEEAETRDEHEERAVHDAGQAERQEHLAEAGA